ncbi:MAG: Fic family protein [Candidatus Margulisbacteria bacterium]|jgi:prophage maintenance system killer protein|nr:Fic family protein [Candidatus Margulisiibacteriota bacterium]
MKTLISSEAIQYIYADYVVVCAQKNLPAQERLTEKQQAEIFGVIKSAANVVFGKKLYPTVLQQAAFILYTLNKRHILLDGNKRFSLMLVLYILHEYKIDDTKMSTDDWEMLIIRIAADVNYSLEKTTAFLENKLAS